MYSASLLVCYIGLMMVLRWRHLLLGWICASKSADFPVSPNAVAPHTNAVHKRVKRLLTSGGSSLSIPETILIVYSSPSNSLVLRRRGLKHM
jgi:hypothetical protein